MPHELTDILRQEIEQSGPISCARFMELALYQPIHGFYERSLQQIGCQGHFYTSVSVGSAFGRLLAFQFARWLEPLQLAAPTSGPDLALSLIEAGAHNGQLAQDILEALDQFHPTLGKRITYWILEPSERRRRFQQDRLRSVSGQFRWITSWSELPARSVRGIIFSNELLDAFPVYRMGWSAIDHTWFEWRVAWRAEGFHWIRSDSLSLELQSELRRPFWAELPDLLLSLLPDGFTMELAPGARAWWNQAADALEEGKLLTCDYGCEAIELLAPHRASGTLRAYRAHRQSGEVLKDPGDQDLTAHVNFSDLIGAGEAAGLKTEFMGPQATFLTRVLEEATRCGSAALKALQLRQFQTLVHPDHLGRAFQFLVQARTSGSAGAHL